jgi:hypothetical protein
MLHGELVQGTVCTEHLDTSDTPTLPYPGTCALGTRAPVHRCTLHPCTLHP